ncbi:glycoside hydrolase family 18 protein [Ascidiimonas sp. W6]|uniref:glycoside hydrolase family 18 protein n=1 Tax=Ascidiimonas meishanensis TaxID=3128903 RepID=UPI0030EE6673
MKNTRIAIYLGNSLYPTVGNNPDTTIKILQNSPLTSPILSLLNQSAANPDQLVYNDGGNPVFNTQGDYIGSSEWAHTIKKLRGGNVKEVYLSFSTNGTEYMSNLRASNPVAAQKIVDYIKNNLGFDGIDLDYEGSDFSSGAPIYELTDLVIKSGLKLTAAPYTGKANWNAWVQYVIKNGGTVSWLNLQCYAGGKSNNPGDWLDIGVPIVGGSCNSCGLPQTTCRPQDMQALFTLWRTGIGSVPPSCWNGTPNTKPQAIGGGFIWVYASVKDNYSAYINAVAKGLGM